MKLKDVCKDEDTKSICLVIKYKLDFRLYTFDWSQNFILNLHKSKSLVIHVLADKGI